MKNNLFVTTTENLTIMVEEDILLKNEDTCLIIIGGKIYESKTFACINRDGVRRLHSSFIEEFNNNFEDIKARLEILRTETKAREEKIIEVQPIPEAKPQPQQDSLGSRLEQLMLQTLASETVKNMEAMLAPQIDKFIAENYGSLPKRFEVKMPDQEVREIKGVAHSEFETVLNLVNVDIPVFLTGPAGSGKNHLCKMVAEAMGLDFYFTNAVTNEFKLTGFIDANGNYHETEFYKAFKNGGLFMLDEMDASIPEVLIILNAAIANRYFDFPNGKIEAHENFRVIAAGNTVGTGADNEYTGRIQLDAASLDRFALIEIDYDYNIEVSIARGNEELVKFIRNFRSSLQECGIQHLVSYRCLERISKLEGVMDIKRVLKICLFKHLSEDDLKIVISSMQVKNNKYYKVANAIAHNLNEVA